MKTMKDLWEEKEYKDLGFTSQHLRDQAAKLEKSLGNVRNLGVTAEYPATPDHLIYMCENVL